jgi:hypothetical protein
MPTGYEACLTEIAKASGIDMTPNEASSMLDQVLKEVERIRGERALGMGDAAAVAAQEIAERIKAAAAMDRLHALRNAAKREAVITRVRDEGGIKGAWRTIRSVMYWDARSPVSESIQGLWHGRSKQWQASMTNELRSAGLLQAARSGALDHQMSEAIWRANGGAPDPNVTISANAQKIADIIKPYLDNATNRLNAEGARIGNALDYVTHTNWNSRQLRRAAGAGATADEAFEAWWAKERPRMAEKTFDHLEPAPGQTQAEAEKEFGRRVFEATASGIHGIQPHLMGMLDEGSGQYIPPAFEGTRNIARGISQQRVIYWKDARSWADHMKEFGGGDGLYVQTMRTLDQSARKMALIHYLGTNPAASLNMIIRRVQEEYRSDLDGLARFNDRIQNLKNVMGRLDGTLNLPVNEARSNLTEILMAEEMASHLGAVSVTHIAAAPATVTSELVHHGVPRIVALGHTIRAVLGAIGARPISERQEILADAGAYAHSYNTAIAAKWKSDFGFPGFVSWAATNFMRMTGLNRVLDQFQGEGIKGVLMARLGRDAEKTLDQLPAEQAAILRKYRFDQVRSNGINGWDNLRSGPGTIAEGRRYITPSDAIEAEGLTPKERWELADSYLMYLNDAAEHATVTAGVRERAMAYQSSRPGDPFYVMARFIYQFKMWPIAAVHQILSRELFASLSKSQKAINIGWLLALSTMGGALRMMTKDAASGRPQRDYLNPTTLLAALAQGGGLGIYGDFLFGETNRMGAGIVSTALGPITADADRLVKLYQRFREDIDKNPGKAMQHMWPDLAHFAVGHVPFGNLVYLKGALDYLLWFHLYEAASPGWWERTNRRMQKEQGRTMAGYRPGGSIPWTPFGLGAGR